MANIAVLGHGVVGSGVLEVLTSHAASIAKRAKEEIHVKYILDLKEFPGLPYSDRFTKDFNVILNDPEVQIEMCIRDREYTPKRFHCPACGFEPAENVSEKEYAHCPRCLTACLLYTSRCV